MSTLRISNIEAKSVPASATIDEKVKITNSSGDTLVFLDGKTSGITTVGINTTDGNITFDANSNIVVTGIITATRFSGQITPTSLEIGSNIKLGNAGVITATSFVGSGANLTNLPAQVNITNNADNRVITGGSGVNLNGEANLTFDGSLLNVTNTGSYAAHIGGSVYYFKIGQTSTNSSPKIDAIGSNVAIPFLINGTEKIRIDLNGNLVLGASTYQNGGFGGTSHGINIAGTQPQILLHETDTNKDGYFGLAGSILRIQTADAIPVTVWTSDTKRINVHETTGDVSIETGNLVIGTAGKGIDFSATSDASGKTSELLADYEEGTWNPIWSNATSGGTTTSNNMYGKYTRIGRMVHAYFYTWGLPAGNSGNMYLQGFPFTCAANPGAFFCAVQSAFYNMGADNYYNLGCRIHTNQTHAELIFCRKDPGNYVPATFAGFINYYTNFNGVLTYEVA